MGAAWNAINASVHPAMDVLLPRFGNTQKGETFVVVALADTAGAALIERRINERLSQCEQVRKASYEINVTSMIVSLPESLATVDQSQQAAEIARLLYSRIDPFYKEEGVVCDECEENLGGR